MVKGDQIHEILDKAQVPEHSAPFMQAMSGGQPFVAVGYPLETSWETRHYTVWKRLHGFFSARKGAAPVKEVEDE